MNFTEKKIQKQKKLSKQLSVLIALIIIFFWFYLYSSYNNFRYNSIILESREIKIVSWDTFSNLWKKIEEFNNFYYKIYLKNNKIDFNLAEWTYKINTWETLEQTFESLQKPILDEQNVTILEWWNIYDIDAKLVKQWLINSWEYIDYVTNPEKIKALSKYFAFLQNDNLESLEWFLYPETYKINPKEFSINILVIAQLEEFEKRVYKKLFENKYNNSTIYDVVNLASIVEKEEKITENKKIVAWILKKRLNSDWMIWADATVCYPHKLTSQECKMVVSKYIKEVNNYNTRTMKWLPKTPICNPSYETIEATLNDEKTPYWYYLHNVKTWKIYYGKTNAEHEYNKANFMK